MPNRFGRQIPVNDFAVKPLLPDGLLPVQRPDGSELEAVSKAASSLAHTIGTFADEAATAEGKRAGKIAGAESSFRPDGGLSLRARAYDEAATAVYLDKLDAAVREDMLKANQAYSDNPKVLRGALDAIRTEYLSQHVFPEIAGNFDAKFSRLRASYETAAIAAEEKRTATEARTVFSTSLDARRATVARVAQTAGASATANTAIADEVLGFSGVLKSGVDRGFITAPEARLAQKQVAGSAAFAIVTGALDRMPSRDDREAFLADFEARTADLLKGFPGLDADTLGSIKASAARKLKSEIDEEARAERQLDGAARRDTEREGLKLLRDGQLTRDWIDTNSSRLTRRTERELTLAIFRPPAAAPQPKAYAAGMQAALDDPAGADELARGMVARGELDAVSFARIHDAAMRAALDATERPWMNSIRRDMTERLAPGPRQPAALALRQWDAVDAFEDWIAANPSASREDVTAKAGALVDQHRGAAARSERAALGMPRFAQIGRDDMSAATLPAIAQRLKAARAAGDIDEGEFLAEAELLRTWKDHFNRSPKGQR